MKKLKKILGWFLIIQIVKLVLTIMFYVEFDNTLLYTFLVVCVFVYSLIILCFTVWAIFEYLIYND